MKAFERMLLGEHGASGIQILEALKKLVKRKTDVILIAKTSFGKSLIFQLTPLLMADPREPGIALILMPLTLIQQNQAENVKKRGAHLRARCIVLDQDSHNVSTLGPLTVKWKSAYSLPLMGCASY
jgi:superfamily II DNA helicase RecQ